MLKRSGLGKPRLACGAALLLALGGCVSLGGDLPDELLTLTPEAAVATGSSASGTLGDAIAVIEPAVPQRLDVTRIPVTVSDSRVAYLKDAVWVEKPARLFRRLLAETLRADGKRLVLDGAERQFAAATRIEGQLLDMGYDAGLQAAVVRYEAVLTTPDGKIVTRRFEAERAGIAPNPTEVGEALNAAANEVAAQVVGWIG